jgi:hypothetical protein
MPISGADLEALIDYVVTLECQVEFSLKERLLRQKGPAALMEQVDQATSSRPVGNAGQPITTQEEIYGLLREIHRPIVVRKAQKPSSDSILPIEGFFADGSGGESLSSGDPSPRAASSGSLSMCVSCGRLQAQSNGLVQYPLWPIIAKTPC